MGGRDRPIGGVDGPARRAAPPCPAANAAPTFSARFCGVVDRLAGRWVTDTDGISHTAALKIAGNTSGVVPQQAALALDLLGVES